MGYKPGELAGARPWKLAAFTTYALSLSFFETLVLDRLVRGRSSEALVLADAEGIRAALSEKGAQRAGREYELEPICMTAGVFHPKVSFFADGADSHLLVGSGNLTFGGWGRNFELVEHLHPSFAGSAFADAADFFERLAYYPAAAHGAQEHCGRIASMLKRSAQSGGGNDIHMLHSLGQRIGDRLKELADSLGGATRLAVASPYWDEGGGITTLCEELGLSRVHVHAHPATALAGERTDCWPRRARVEVIPVSIDEFAADLRPLHAKAFEIQCRKGRLLVSGSANGTRAALYGPNAEACIARIQPITAASWALSPAMALPPFPEAEKAASADGPPPPAVLRASLSGDLLEGRILSARMQGEAVFSRMTAEGPEHVCNALLEEDGSFRVKVAGLEAQALRGGRFVLQVQCLGNTAEGFVSLVFETNLRKFAGKAASSIMDIIRGSDSHGTVIVLMEWAHENIAAFMHPGNAGGSGQQGERAPRAQGAFPLDIFDDSQDAGHHKPGARSGDPAWARFLDSLMAALREKRGPVEPEDEDDDGENGQQKRGRPGRSDLPAKAKYAIGQVIELLLQAGNATPTPVALRALDLAAFACNRLPDKVEAAEASRWLRGTMGPLLTSGVPEERLEDVASAAVALAGSFPDADTARHARQRLRRLSWPLNGPPPSPAFSKDFTAVVEGSFSPDGFSAAWKAIASVTTWREQARSYVDALASGTPSEGYEDLLAKLPREASILRGAIGSEQGSKRIRVVNRPTATCCRTLPKGEYSNLVTFGVGRAANCCQRLLVWPEAAANA